MPISGGLVAAGGLLALFVISGQVADTSGPQAQPAPDRGVGAHCDLCGPPLRPGSREEGVGQPTTRV
jgi:hypothetical protein